MTVRIFHMVSFVCVCVYVWVCLGVCGCVYIVNFLCKYTIHVYYALTSLTECFDDSENHFIISQIKLSYCTV